MSVEEKLTFYLDISIHRNEKIDTGIYRKPICTEKLI
jgi:hypothetical protein